jgi:lipid-A-disaccharide synthase
MTTIFLSAAEPSGDALGAALIRALKAKRPDLRFVGGGGEKMVAAGLEKTVSTDSLAVMGPLDALKVLPRAKAIIRQLGDLAAAEKPAAGILIDSWAFSKALADRLRKSSPETKLVKLAAPQVWASRPKRAVTAAELFDLILCLLPFEPRYFEEAGGKAIFVGNPNFQGAAQQPRSGPAFRAKHGIGDAPLLLLLPGSRMGEVKYLLPVFEETLPEIIQKVRGLRTVVITAPAVEAKVREEVKSWPTEVLVVPPEERFSAFDAGDVALAASGTVTTELALTGTPMVVTYKVGPVTAFWARQVITTPYITILNILAGSDVIPERIQDDSMPTQLCADVVRLFTNEDARRQQMSAFRRLLPKLIGGEDAADASARAVLALVDGDDSGDLDSRAAR